MSLEFGNLSVYNIKALCIGIPTVAISITGATEILFNSRYGLLTEEDITSIYNGVKSLIDDDSLRKEYATKALERAEIFQVKETMASIYSMI